MPKKQTKTSTRQSIRVSVDDDHLGSVDAVVERLKAKGVTVDGVMKKLGTVTGSVAATGFDAVAHIPGVAHVEKAATFQLPPPDADVQ